VEQAVNCADFAEIVIWNNYYHTQTRWWNSVILPPRLPSRASPEFISDYTVVRRCGTL